MCQKLGIEKTHTTPYRPQSDGLVERYNATLQRTLSMLVNENRNDWDDHLPYVLMAYRASVQESTKCTPCSLMFGREISLPLDHMVGQPPEMENFDISCHVEYYEWLKETMCQSFEKGSRKLRTGSATTEKYYDRGLKVRSYEVGSFIWRWYPPTANVKLGLGWTGPYKVLEKLSECTYKIQKSPNDRSLVVHVDHMKPYEGCGYSYTVARDGGKKKKKVLKTQVSPLNHPARLFPLNPLFIRHQLSEHLSKQGVDGLCALQCPTLLTEPEPEM